MFIFCCGAPRSGSTLNFQIVSEIIEMKGLGKRLTYVEPERHKDYLMEFAQSNKLYAFKTHEPTGYVLEALDSNLAMGFYIYRDIRDVAVSVKNFRKANLEEYFNKGFFNKYVKNHEMWINSKNVHVLKYEDIVFDLKKYSNLLASRLNVKLTDKEIHYLQEKFALSKQQDYIKGISPNLKVDTHTNLHFNHINSGKANQWITGLNLYEIFKIQNISEEWFIKNGYQLKKFRLREYFVLYSCFMLNWTRKIYNSLYFKYRKL